MRSCVEHFVRESLLEPLDDKEPAMITEQDNRPTSPSQAARSILATRWAGVFGTIFVLTLMSCSSSGDGASTDPVASAPVTAATVPAPAETVAPTTTSAVTSTTVTATTTATTTTTVTTTTAGATFPLPVNAFDEGGGPVLVDAQGMTVYGTKSEGAGTSTCEGACAEAWPPILVPSADLPDGLDPEIYSIVPRADGTFQLKAGDYPVYTFTGDSAPGDYEGQGVNGDWFPLNPFGRLIQG